MTILAFVLARLKEPSSYAGLGMLLAAAGIDPSDGTVQAIVQCLTASAGLAAVLMPEGGAAPAAVKLPPAALALLLAAGLAPALGACGSAAETSAVAQALDSSPQGANLLAGLDVVVGEANTVVQKANAKIGITPQDEQTICGAINWGDAVFDLAAGFTPVPAAVVTAVNTANSGIQTVCAAQTGTAPVNAGDVQTLLSAWQTITSGLSSGGVATQTPVVAPSAATPAASGA
jgi:hypothetical protein